MYTLISSSTSSSDEKSDNVIFSFILNNSEKMHIERAGDYNKRSITLMCFLRNWIIYFSDREHDFT